MTQITEDYCSFETAKLLKEKGFECEKNSITAMYNEIGKFHSLSTAADEYYYDYNDFDEYDYVAPTLQMTMRWLREVHKIEIRVIYDNDKLSWYGACNPMSESQILLGFGRKSKSYEEACESAIKYCLEHLI